MDCNDGSALTIKWMGIDFLATTKSGDLSKLDVPLKEPLYFREETSIGLKFTEHRLVFKLGETVVIPPKALAEICFFIHLAAKDIIKSALDYAFRKGVKAKVPDSD